MLAQVTESNLQRSNQLLLCNKQMPVDGSVSAAVNAVGPHVSVVVKGRADRDSRVSVCGTQTPAAAAAGVRLRLA